MGPIYMGQIHIWKHGRILYYALFTSKNRWNRPANAQFWPADCKVHSWFPSPQRSLHLKTHTHLNNILAGRSASSHEAADRIHLRQSRNLRNTTVPKEAAAVCCANSRNTSRVFSQGYTEAFDIQLKYFSNKKIKHRRLCNMDAWCIFVHVKMRRVQVTCTGLETHLETGPIPVRSGLKQGNVPERSLWTSRWSVPSKSGLTYAVESTYQGVQTPTFGEHGGLEVRVSCKWVGSSGSRFAWMLSRRLWHEFNGISAYKWGSGPDSIRFTVL